MGGRIRQPFKGAALLVACALAFGGCQPGAEEGPAGQPTQPTLQTPVPALTTHPPDPVLPMPPESPGTFPPGDQPSPIPTT
ncbi:MAG: hypothetical protein M3253_09080 [Chloroflexota bacterium]|nr:hypothetical protein [Chloroflexota bacterium]